MYRATLNCLSWEDICEHCADVKADAATLPSTPPPAHRLSPVTYLKPISQLRFDYDTTTTRLRRKIDMLIFFLRRIASNGSRRA